MDYSTSESENFEKLPFTSSRGWPKILLIEIVEAQITYNFQKAGKMDPYIMVQSDKNATLSERDGVLPSHKPLFSAQTPTAWNAHQFPAWHYTCPNFLVTPSDFCSKITFFLWNDSSIPFNRSLCGHSSVSVRQLLESDSPILELPILQSKTNADCGVLVINVKVSNNLDQVSIIEPDLFESPVKRLGVSGGTAPFFKLVLTEEGLAKFQSKTQCEKKSKTYFIGKDYSRASDEIDFYEQARKMKNNCTMNEEDARTVELLTFMFDYIGVLAAPEQLESDLMPRQMLCLQNLRDGCKKLRLLDIKIGQKTAQSGWHGKTSLHAFRQTLLDKMTNSTYEGYRLEGFDGMPSALVSMNPLLETFGKLGIKSEKRLNDANVEKKSRRIMLQKMTSNDIFMHFTDLHLESWPCNAMESIPVGNLLSGAEQSEIVLHEMVRQLFCLAVCCDRILIPQKWIGSSIALGFDALTRPERSREQEERLRSTVIVKIFDWGRSELLKKKEFDTLSSAEKDDRNRFWTYYKDAVYRLSFNAALFYYNQFTAQSWGEVSVCVLDYDALSSDDLIGEVTLPLRETKMTSYQLIGIHGRSCGSISLSISWCDAEYSRLAGAWKVHINSATNLPAKDLTSYSSDPYCLVLAKSNNMLREYSQITSVKANTLQPKWEETVEIPVVANSSNFLDSLKGSGLDNKTVDHFFHIGSSIQYEVNFKQWATAIKNAKSLK